MSVDTSTPPPLDSGLYFRAVRIAGVLTVRFTLAEYRERMLRAEIRRLFDPA